MARRIEPSNDVLHDEIPDCGPVPHVEIERHELLLEVQFRVVAKAGARIGLQAIAERLNSEGIATVRGGAEWRPSSIQTVLGHSRRKRRRATVDLPPLPRRRGSTTSL